MYIELCQKKFSVVSLLLKTVHRGRIEKPYFRSEKIDSINTMALLVAFKHIFIALVSTLGFIVLLDLIRNQSLWTQYLHLATFLGMAFSTAFLTGKTVLRFLTRL